jgi:hypothetical protein
MLQNLAVSERYSKALGVKPDWAAKTVEIGATMARSSSVTLARKAS